MFDRIRSGWDLTLRAWGVVRSHPGLATLPVKGGFLALVAFLVLGIPGAVVLGHDDTTSTVIGVALRAVGAYLSWFAVIFFNVALAAGADQALRGDTPDIGAAQRLARSRLATIAAWALVSLTASMVLGGLRDRGGVLGRVGAAIGGAIWSLVTFLVVPVLAFEGIGPVAAMRRSAALFRERWGQQVTGGVVIGGVSGLVAAIGVVIGVVGVVVFAAGGDGAGLIGGLLVLVGVVVSIGAAVFGGATRGVFGVALYRYMADDRPVGPFTATDLAAVVRTQ